MLNNPPPPVFDNQHRLLLKRSSYEPSDEFIHELWTLDLFGEQHEIRSSSFLEEVMANSYFVGSSCDGLLCFDDLNGHIVVWNPTTGEGRSLPQSDVPRPPGLGYTNFCCSGLGFDSISQDYKVIRFMTHYYQKEENDGIDVYPVFAGADTLVELYSLKSDTWVEVPNPPDVMFCSDSLPAYINGSCYWLAYGSDGGYFIQSYDFSRASFSSLPYPPTEKKRDLYTCYNLVDLNGLLGFTVLQVHKSCFEVWVLNDLSWAKEFEVVLSRRGEVQSPLGFCNQLFFLRGTRDQLLVYDHTTQELNEVTTQVNNTFPLLTKVYHDYNYDYPGKMEIFSYQERTTPLRSPLDKSKRSSSSSGCIQG